MKKYPTIAIIGAGPSGISTYIEIIRLYHAYLSNVMIFDPKGVMNNIGFLSEVDSTITNTSVGITSITAEDPLDLYKWLNDKYPSLNIKPQDFISRKLVNEYCQNRLNSSVLFAEQFDCNTNIIKQKVLKIDEAENGFNIISSADNYLADIVILATGMSLTDPYPHYGHLSNYVPVPYPESEFLHKLNNNSRVLILGSKLSAIDISIAINHKQPSAKIVMASPSGELPSVRTELLNKAKTNFNSVKLLRAPQEKLLSETFRAAAITFKNLATERRSNNLVPCDAQGILEQDILNCQYNNNDWQYSIAGFIDEINEVWPVMTSIQKDVFIKKSKVFISRFVSSFPIKNAEIIHRLLKSGTLKIKNISLIGGIEYKNNIFQGVNELAGSEFDLVINATGIKNNPLPACMKDSLSLMGIIFNNNGGIRLDHKTMKAISGNKQLHFYVNGGPAVGELMVVNYIRASTIQARKIGQDLAFIIRPNTQY